MIHLSLLAWRGHNLVVLAAYAPTQDAEDATKRAFCTNVRRAINQTPKSDVLVGDWKARPEPSPTEQNCSSLIGPILGRRSICKQWPDRQHEIA